MRKPRHIVRRALVWVMAISVSACAISPKPLTDADLEDLAQQRVAALTAGQDAPDLSPVLSIDLYEAMARALKHNLDHRVQLADTRLKRAELNLANASLFPNATLSTGYNDRNNEIASSSFNVVTDTFNFGASTSQERQSANSDLEVSWNILDFGLSYIRAKQIADKVLINEELERKITIRLVEQVRDAYWRALSYQELIERLSALEGKVNRTLANSRALSTNRDTNPTSALKAERELLLLKRTIDRLQRDIVVAKSELAALMNIDPTTSFKLTKMPHNETDLELPVSVDEMMRLALRKRPELREISYQQRINQKEAKASLLTLLPGIQLFVRPGWDSNDFLLNNSWVSWGATASWNLLKAYQYPARRKVIRKQDEYLEAQAMALTMTVMTQVHLSRIRYEHLREELKTAKDYKSVQNRLLNQFQNARAERAVSEQALIREEMNALIADSEYNIAFSQLQSAYANIYVSLGVQPYGAIDRTASVEDMAEIIRNYEAEQMPALVLHAMALPASENEQMWDDELTIEARDSRMAALDTLISKKDDQIASVQQLLAQTKAQLAMDSENNSDGQVDQNDQ